MTLFREASEPRGRHPERERRMWFLVGKSRFLTAEAVWNDKGNGKRSIDGWAES